MVVPQSALLVGLVFATIRGIDSEAKPREDEGSNAAAYVNRTSAVEFYRLLSAHKVTSEVQIPDFFKKSGISPSGIT